VVVRKEIIRWEDLTFSGLPMENIGHPTIKAALVDPFAQGKS